VSWALLLDAWQEFDPRPLSAEVAREYRISPLEAKIQLRRSGGIVLRDASEETARRIAGLLKEQGVASHAVEESSLPTLPPIVRAAVVGHSEDMLQFETDPPVLCAWSGLKVISAAIIRQEGYVEVPVVPDLPKELTPEELRMARENAILRRTAPVPAAPVDPRKMKTVLDLIETDQIKKANPAMDLLLWDQSTWIRLSGESMVYSRGKLKVGGGLGFSVLLKDLVRECDLEAFTPLALNCFSGDDIRVVSFSSLADLTRYTTWFAFRKSIPA
jgi:hypothetical protein